MPKVMHQIVSDLETIRRCCLVGQALFKPSGHLGSSFFQHLSQKRSTATETIKPSKEYGTLCCSVLFYYNEMTKHFTVYNSDVHSDYLQLTANMSHLPVLSHKWEKLETQVTERREGNHLLSSLTLII